MIRTILVISIAVAGLWSAGWFAMAEYSKPYLVGQLSRMATRNVDVKCGQLQPIGYPFSFGYTCVNADIGLSRHGLRAQSKSVDLTINILSFRTMRLDFPDPVFIQSDRSKANIVVTAEDLEARATLSKSFVEEVNLSGNQISVSARLGNGPPLSVSSTRFDATVIPIFDQSGNNTLVSVDATALKVQNNSIGDVTVETNIRNLLQIILKPTPDPFATWQQNGGRFDPLELTIETSSQGIALAGNLALNQYMQLEGDLELRVSDPKLNFTNQTSKQQYQPQSILNALNVVRLVGKPGKDNGRAYSTLPISIKGGKIKAGFFALGTIPPLL